MAARDSGSNPHDMNWDHQSSELVIPSQISNHVPLGWSILKILTSLPWINRKSDVSLPVCVSCAVKLSRIAQTNPNTDPWRRIYLHHVNDSQVRLLRWGVLSLHEHQGHLVPLQEDGETGNTQAGFFLFFKPFVYMHVYNLFVHDTRRMFLCPAPWEWCQVWKLLQAETTHRLSWSEYGDGTSDNLHKTRPVETGDRHEDVNNETGRTATRQKVKIKGGREKQTERQTEGSNLMLPHPNLDNNGLHSLYRNEGRCFYSHGDRAGFGEADVWSGSVERNRTQSGIWSEGWVTHESCRFTRLDGTLICIQTPRLSLWIRMRAASEGSSA